MVITGIYHTLANVVILAFTAIAKILRFVWFTYFPYERNWVSYVNLILIPQKVTLIYTTLDYMFTLNMSAIFINQ